MRSSQKKICGLSADLFITWYDKLSQFGCVEPLIVRRDRFVFNFRQLPFFAVDHFGMAATDGHNRLGNVLRKADLGIGAKKAKFVFFAELSP
jgi:hypothetical protein